jgi:Fe-S cluster assembly ATP-binding protein
MGAVSQTAEQTKTGPALLEVRGLHASVEGKEILKGIDLAVPQGEVHAIMGPNGSGKSTLANVIMGRPGYMVTAGRVRFKGRDITTLKPDERAREGLFLAFQYPTEIPGVSVVNFLRSAYSSVKGEKVSALAFRKRLKEKMEMLGVEDEMVARYVNQGFSGGEKKKNEVLQLAVLEPDIAILDETDSGLDIDSLKAVAGGVQQLVGPELGILLITHYQRILNYITPDRIHVMMGGRIVLSGGPELAHELEQKGYEGLRTELGLEPGGSDDEAAGATGERSGHTTQG